MSVESVDKRLSEAAPRGVGPWLYGSLFAHAHADLEAANEVVRLVKPILEGYRRLVDKPGYERYAAALAAIDCYEALP